MSAVFDSIEDVKSQASRYDAVLVAYSGGKDSLVTIDLLAKYFKRIEGFCMSFVVGLDVTKKYIQFAKDRWGVDIQEVEHWAARKQKLNGIRCPPTDVEGPLSLAETIAEQKKAYGIDLCATGTRAAESLGRRAGLRRREQGIASGAWPGDWHPIAWWTRGEVVAYLKHNNLPLEESGKDMQGWSNEASSILRLHDEHPADYQRWLKEFPYASTVVKRRELYGIGA